MITLTRIDSGFVLLSCSYEISNNNQRLFLFYEKATIAAHGAVFFCLINSLPSLAIVCILVRELFRENMIFLMPMAQFTIIVSPLLLHFVATISTHLMATNEPNSIPMVERIEGGSLTATSGAIVEHGLSVV